MIDIPKITIHHLLNAISQIEAFTSDNLPRGAVIPSDEDGYEQYLDGHKLLWENIEVLIAFLQVHTEEQISKMAKLTIHELLKSIEQIEDFSGHLEDPDERP